MSGKIGLFSFFSGAGFLDLGFEDTGLYDILMTNEYHKPFREIYSNSRKSMGLPLPKFENSINDISDYNNAENIRILKQLVTNSRQTYNIIGFVGGPPCPDFSVGGKNKGKEGENGKLSGNYINLIKTIEPDFFLFENVKGLYRTTKHREFFETLKNTLKKSGYYLSEKLINSIEYGVPQDRQRIILVGFKKNLLSELDFKLNGSPIIKNFNWENHTNYNLKDVFSKNWPTISPFESLTTKYQPHNIIPELTVEHWFQKNNVNNHFNSSNHFIPRAGLSKFLSIQEGDDLKKSYKRLHRWRYSPTAAYGNNEVHLHPYKPRRISAAEALSLQSLPKNFVMPHHISLTDMFKAIGNGVPYLAANGLAKTIYDFLFDNPIKDVRIPYGEVNSKQFNSVYQSA